MNSSMKLKNYAKASVGIATAVSMNSVGIIQRYGGYCRKRQIQFLRYRNGRSSSEAA